MNMIVLVLMMAVTVEALVEYAKTFGNLDNAYAQQILALQQAAAQAAQKRW